jgi:hypothetical protein
VLLIDLISFGWLVQLKGDDETTPTTAPTATTNNASNNNNNNATPQQQIETTLYDVAIVNEVQRNINNQQTK